MRNKSTWPVQPKNPKGEVQEDWGMISYDRSRKALVLRQFHIEGFVNQSEAIESIPSGYSAREIYRMTGPDAFVERFDLAPPGKEFEVYSETKFRRQR